MMNIDKFFSVDMEFRYDSKIDALELKAEICTLFTLIVDAGQDYLSMDANKRESIKGIVVNLSKSRCSRVAPHVALYYHYNLFENFYADLIQNARERGLYNKKPQ